MKATLLFFLLIACATAQAQSRGSSAIHYSLAEGESTGLISEDSLTVIASGEAPQAYKEFTRVLTPYWNPSSGQTSDIRYDVVEEARRALRRNPHLREYAEQVIRELPLTRENSGQRGNVAYMLGWVREPWSFRLLGEMLLDERRINYGDANPESIAAALAASVDIGSDNYEYAYTVIGHSEIFGNFIGTLPDLRRLWLANEHQLEGLLEGSAEVIVPPDDAPTSRAEQAAQSAAQPPPQPEPAAPEPEPKPTEAAAEPRPAPRWPWLAAAGAAALLLLGRLLRARRAQP